MIQTCACFPSHIIQTNVTILFIVKFEDKGGKKKIIHQKSVFTKLTCIKSCEKPDN